MPLAGHDLAILTARFGAARFGASRFGFIPCPGDVRGTGTEEPGEYVWKEDVPPSQDTPTAWTLASEDCVCRQLCTLALGVISLSDATPQEDVDITASVTLSGVLGLVEGIASINWGDGRHDQQDFTQLANGVLEFDGHYHVAGDYTITVIVTDERGCTAEATLPVTVGATAPLAADFTIDVNGAGATGGSGAQTTGWTGDSTVTGGSGSYSYAWTVWNESSSEIAPLYTSAVADPNFPPNIPASCVGQAKLVVTDTLTMAQVTVGPYAWDWDCI